MTHFIFDCDDVLLDWEGSFARFLGDRGILLDPAGPQEWDLSHWIGCSQEVARIWVRRHNQSLYFARMQATPGAHDLLWQLHGARHRISVLTACGDDEKTQRARWGCLDREFNVFAGSDFHSPFTSADVHFLPLGASKFDFLHALPVRREIVFIEDNFEHARSGALCGIQSYCLRRSHNRHQEVANPDSGVIWIDNLDEIARRHIIQKESAE